MSPPAMQAWPKGTQEDPGPNMPSNPNCVRWNNIAQPRNVNPGKLNPKRLFNWEGAISVATRILIWRNTSIH